MNARRLLVLSASAAVSALSLYFVLRSVPLADLAASMGAAHPLYLLLATLALFCALATRGIRWWWLLGRRVTIPEATHMINVMFLGNQLPFRLGEVARGILAAQRGLPLMTSGASIVVERLIDMVLVVLVLTATVSQLPAAPSEISERAWLLGALALIGFLALIGLAHNPRIAQGLLRTLERALPILSRFPLETLLGHLLDGLRPLKDSKTLAATALWSALGWISTLFSFYFLHLALGIEVNYAISVPLGIGLTALSIAFPISIAALGPFELAVLATGQLVGMSDLEAISLGLLLHGINILSYALWGTVGLLALGASPAALVKNEAPASDSV